MLEEELNELKAKIRDLKYDKEEADANFEKLSKLYELGIIDDKGEFINNDMKLN